MQRTTAVVFNAVLLLGLVPLLEANQCIGRPDGYFANDFRSCEGFFTCVRQTEVPGRCPDGFYFNEERQICDNPWNVICLICEESDEASGTEPNIEFFPIERECRKYTLCANGVGFLRECSAGLMFNPVSRTCELEANVDCEESVCPNNINPEEATLVPDPHDCARYFICFRREPLGGSQACNDGLLFDPINWRCDIAENVECEVVTIPPDLSECPPSGLHYIPQEGSCTTFFICFDGDRIGPVQCADGLIFDINTRNCRPRTDEGSQCITDPPLDIFGVQIKK
ncbi:peritrophin-44-like [Aedes albopictus]|uniref:Chitin-binding type-2 domain-containing protein n=1 Tax=Aedes albopictus TaxID=7160 RepID=A0ABM1ZSR1_AEDAL|nr:peritrophin-44-like [Aedes albopictus]